MQKKRKFKKIYILFIKSKNTSKCDFYIIYNFIVLKLNSQQIIKNTEIKYKKNLVSYATILNILNKIRHTIEDGLKQMFRKSHIGIPPELKKIVAID